MPRTVLFFDMDGTLVQNAFSDTLFPSLTEQLSQATGLPAAEIMRRLLVEWDRREREEPDPVRVMDWDDMAETVARDLGVDCPVVLSDLCSVYAHPPYIRAIDNARDVLHQLQRPWRTLAIASRGLGKYQIPVLEGLGLAPLLDALVFPDTAGRAKADPAFFQTVANGADLAVHTGDLYPDDVLYPSQAGLKTVWKRPLYTSEAAIDDPIARAEVAVLPPGNTVRPTALIRRLGELPPVIDRLETALLG